MSVFILVAAASGLNCAKSTPVGDDGMNARDAAAEVADRDDGFDSTRDALSETSGPDIEIPHDFEAGHDGTDLSDIYGPDMDGPDVADSGIPDDIMDVPDGSDAADDLNDPDIPVNPLLPKMPLRTAGRYIVDADGARVKLAGFNWNDGEGPDFVMSGLAKLHRDDISAKIAGLGFNTVRLVWSNELVETNPVVAADKLTANPDLIGKTALEVMDAVVESLASHGVMIVMNNHISDAIYCCRNDDDNTLWYNDRFPETSWINDWQTIARRYRNQPAVIGADLRNEPRFLAFWGPDAGEGLDWAAAAQRGGNAVLDVAANWLIFVEGINYAQDLGNVTVTPLNLNLSGRLVYSVHDYPWFHQNGDGDAMRAKWTKNWAYLISGENPVPVWVGEFGLCNTCFNRQDQTGLWFETFTAFIRDNDLDWSWWLLHEGTSPDGWGIFNEDTNEPWSPELMQILQGLAAPESVLSISPSTVVSPSTLTVTEKSSRRTSASL